MSEDIKGVEGYESVNTPNTGREWGGLEYNSYSDTCLLKGSVGKDYWFYAVGATEE